MTLPEACDLLVTLTDELRDEKACRTSLEEDLQSYRELVSVLLTELYVWQRDPERQERRLREMAGIRRRWLTASFLADVGRLEAARELAGVGDGL